MSKQNGLYVADGIMSFIKGCGSFMFNNLEGGILNLGGSDFLPLYNLTVLNQESENPSVYTRLSCFLPWIAEQYDLSYTSPENVDEECSTGYGDPDDVTQTDEKICRTNPKLYDPYGRGFLELPCIFPYYVDGVLFESCTQFDVGGLNYPVFACPVRNVTSKQPGTNINSFRTSNSSGILSLFQIGFCEDSSNLNSGDLYPPLDPESSCGTNSKLPFAQCKNNCPGGR